MPIDANVLNDIQNITLSVAANGLTSLIAKTGQKLEKLIVGKEFIEKQQLEKTALQPILHDAINDAAEHVQLDTSKGIEVVALFLHTPEVEEIVRQIYSTKLVQSKARSKLPTIHKTFLSLLTQYTSVYPYEVRPEADELSALATFLFETLVKECELLLDSAIDKGILAAHEAKEAFRYNILHSQVEAIQKELKLLSASQKMDIKAILEFENQYTKQVGQRHSRITPPTLESAIPQPIDTLYVYPKFVTVPKKKQEPEVLKKNDFFSCIYRAVLLGNPGGGKSTLTLKLCHDLANNYSQRVFAGRKELTPILVILRKYGAEKKERKCSILEFIETEVKVTYQLPEPPHNAFRYLLLTGRAVIIFDGLDELLDTTYRQEIRSDVESFCHLYPSVPVLVTSREVGYEEAPLDKNMFEVFRLDEFDEEQIKDYVKKWFDVADAEDIPDKQRQSKAEASLQDSKIVPDLRSNPLMLGLLCTIYREEHYIPRYRPDVYEKCALMLFERWDKNRSIYTPPLPEEYVRPLMEYLANWIYKDEQLRAGITEEELSAQATEYLHEWLYENIYKAEKTANEFVKFCTGRAWVFTDTGTKKNGESLYQFAHTTFLEYFAAAYLVHTSRSPEALLTVLSPRIAKKEWDVIAQLAFQLQSKKNIGAGDELLTILLKQSYENTSIEGWNLLSFAIRCLQFIVPRPNVRRSLTKACIERCISFAHDRTEKEDLSKREEYTHHPRRNIPEYEHLKILINDLLRAVPENITTIIECLEELLIEQIRDDNETKALMALDLTIFLTFGFRKQNFEMVRNRIFNACSNRIESLYPKSLFLCSYGVIYEDVLITDFIKWHHTESLFCSFYFTMFPSCGYSSIFERVASSVWQKDNYTNLSKLLRPMVNALLFYPPPWVKGLENPWNNTHPTFAIETLDFEAFVVLALLLERSEVSRKAYLRKYGNNQHTSSFYHLALRARFKPDLRDKVKVGLDKSYLTSKQQDFIQSWVGEEINLVGK